MLSWTLCGNVRNKEYALVNCLLENCENLIDAYMSVFESQVLNGSFDVSRLSYFLGFFCI